MIDRGIDEFGKQRPLTFREEREIRNRRVVAEVHAIAPVAGVSMIAVARKENPRLSGEAALVRRNIAGLAEPAAG